MLVSVLVFVAEFSGPLPRMARMRAFKRDLLNPCLTEAETHEIISGASATAWVIVPKSPDASGAGDGSPEASAGPPGP